MYDKVKMIDDVIVDVKGVILSPPYGSGNTLGQPKGVKSLGFIEITSQSGKTGIGETYSGVYVPELIPKVVEFLKDFIIGKEVSDETIIRDISQIPFIGRNGLINSIASGIDIALWDLRAKILEKPLYELFGYELSDSVDVYASSGSAALGPDDIKKDVEEILALGHKAYKMRVGFQDWKTDIKRVEAARIALGDDNKLMVDAIMGTLRPTWSVEEAISKANDLSEFNLEWLEEPLYPEDISGLADLKKHTNVPIAAGEAYSGWGEYMDVLSSNAVDILQFDATHSGGVTSCLNLSDQCSEKDIRSAVHVWGSAVATSSNAHLALSRSNIEILEIPMVPLEITEKMWIDKPIIKDGKWIASKQPGLGIVLTDEIKDKYRFVEKSGYKLPSKK